MGFKELTKHVKAALQSPSVVTAEAQRLLTQYRAETENNGRGKPFQYDSKPSDFPGGRAILESAPEMQVAVLRVMMAQKGSDNYGSPLKPLKDQLLARKLLLSLGDVEVLLEQAGNANSWIGRWAAAIKKTRQYMEAGGTLTPALTAGLNAIRTQATAYNSADNRKFIMQVDDLLGNNKQVQPDPGEAFLLAIY